MADIYAIRPAVLDFLNVNLRLCALLTVIAVYALWGEPTPDGFGAAELLVGAGLVFAVGFRGLASVFDFRGMASWQKAGVLFLAYGLAFGLLNGLAYGNSLSLIIRDIVPFLFLFLPLFLATLLRSLHDREALMLCGAVTLLGVVFALRVIAPALTGGGVPAFAMAVRDPALLANAPTVLFAAALLIGVAGYQMTRGLRWQRMSVTVLFLAVALIPLAAMAAIQQRASVAYLVLAIGFLMLAGLYKRPYRMGLPVLVAGAAVVVMAPIWMDIVQTLSHKHALVGFNMRGREAAAVLDVIDDSFWSVLFGAGWGTTVQSPAVGGATVNFTHSLITSTWLKTGLCGVVLMGFYMGALAVRLAQMVRHYPIVAAAIAGPFLIDIFLYASYKSLDFGLLLLMIPLWVDRAVLLKKA